MSNSNFGFLALALRQRLIKRWSLMHSVQPESVLEHSADALDKWFGDGLGHSVDKLLAGGNDD